MRIIGERRMFDSRMPQARKIVEAIVTKGQWFSTKVLLTEVNKLILIVDGTLLYEIELKDIVNPAPDVAFAYLSVVDSEDENYVEDDKYLREEMISKFYAYRNYSTIHESFPVVAHIDELRGNEDFESLISLKADDGMKYFKILGLDMKTTYFIPMFSGFPGLSKPDKMGITIYDIHNGFLINRMTIFKKKINRTINVYFRSIRLS